jgi:hypothetical protein
MEEINSQSAKINWRQFGKHWIVVFILAIIAGFVIWGMLHLGPFLKNWQDNRAAQAIKNQLQIQYRNDKYGGNSPEETYNLFTMALEKGDTDLASKYFVLEKQNQWQKALQLYKDKSLLVGFIRELKNTETKWQKIQLKDSTKAEFDYAVVIEKDTVANFNGQDVSIKAGNYKGSILLQKYPSGNWKLSDL